MNTNQHRITQKFVRLPKVMDITGGSRSWIYQEITEGRFPKPVLLGKRSVAWIEHEIFEWIDQRINQSRAQGEQS